MTCIHAYMHTNIHAYMMHTHRPIPYHSTPRQARPDHTKHNMLDMRSVGMCAHTHTSQGSGKRILLLKAASTDPPLVNLPKPRTPHVVCRTPTPTCTPKECRVRALYRFWAIILPTFEGLGTSQCELFRVRAERRPGSDPRVCGAICRLPV